MRVTLTEPGATRSQFAENIRAIVDETVTEQMLDDLFDTLDADGDGELNDVECEHVNQVLIEPLNRLRTALIVVDFQNDFVAGSMAIKNGSAAEDPAEALVPLNRLLVECPFTLIVYTMDWHPYNHISFWEHCRNSDRKLCAEDRVRKLKPFDVVRFEAPDVEQKLYPAHCVEDSWGADLDSQLIRVKDSVLIKKGTETYADSYSAFKDNKKKRSTELEDVLRSEAIDAIFVCGLAYDVCVAATANDGVELGFLTALIADCSKGLNTFEMERVNKELSQKSVPVLNSDRVHRIVADNLIPWQWIRCLVGLTVPPTPE
uniref:nicotinamidase n=1 Tax=Parascaris univalens TaxID=6257 RepID=A0A915A921_PARUN